MKSPMQIGGSFQADARVLSRDLKRFYPEEGVQ
jgi:hypothetical protein